MHSLPTTAPTEAGHVTSTAWSNLSTLRPANWPGLVAVVALHLTLGWAAFHLPARQQVLEPGGPLTVRWIEARPAAEPVLNPPPVELPAPKPPEQPPPRSAQRTIPIPTPKPPLVTVDAPAPARLTPPPKPTRPQKVVTPAPEPTPVQHTVPPREVVAEPMRSRRLGEEGEVLLRVLVNPYGRVEQVRLQQSCGHRRLDRAAVTAVRRWHFSPARQSARPVSAWVLVPILFELNKG
jgi:protein TonB